MILDPLFSFVLPLNVYDLNWVSSLVWPFKMKTEQIGKTHEQFQALFILYKTAFLKSRPPYSPAGDDYIRSYYNILQAFIHFWNELCAKSTKEERKCNRCLLNILKWRGADMESAKRWSKIMEWGNLPSFIFPHLFIFWHGITVKLKHG